MQAVPLLRWGNAISPSRLIPAGDLSGEKPVANEAAKSRRMGAGYFLLNGLNFGMAALDVSLGQRCLDERHCREANPLMPPSLAGRISVVGAVVGFGIFTSHRLKRHASKLWWLPPTFGIVAHSAGIASEAAHE